MPRTDTALMLAAALLCGGYACTDRVEGCLDVRATNFRPDADRNCCCEWPPVSVAIDHLMGEENHSPDSVYSNDAGQAYRLLDAFLLLSDFRLHFQGQAPLSVWRDTIRLMNADSTFSWVRNQVVLVTRATNTIQLGRFIADGQLDSITFALGAPSTINAYPPGRWPEGHTIRRNGEFIWDTDLGYVSAATLHVPTPFTDTLHWRTYQPIAITLPVDKVIAPGFSPAELRIRIDYLGWFALQNVAAAVTLPDDQWPDQIRSSLP